jgi:hypothetical protein
VTGFTYSSDFPIRSGAFQTTCNGCPLYSDAYVTKLNLVGNGLLYSTYLGGIYGDDGRDIALDSNGAAYIVGVTPSYDFPTTPGAFQTSFAGGVDAFMTKLNTTGSALAYSTFLGGGEGDVSYGMAVDTSGMAYLTGSTTSLDFPVTAGAFQPVHGTGTCGPPPLTYLCPDAFVSKVNPIAGSLTPTPSPTAITTTPTPPPSTTPTPTPTPTVTLYELYLPLVLNGG